MDHLLDLLGKHLPGFEHAITQEAGEESLLADQALAGGHFDLLVAVGGDGTWSNVADRVVSSGREDVAFGLLAAGTGNDFGRNFGLAGRDPESAVRTLAEGRVMRVDVGRVVTRGSPVTVRDNAPDPVEGRHFLNLVGFGFDVAVIEDTEGARFLRGALLYKVTALKNLFSFPGVNLELTSDEPTVDGEQLMLTISNGPFFGGAFPIAPAAELADGLLDACAIGNASPFTRMRLFQMAEKGHHVGSPFVHTRRSGRFTVSFTEPPKYEVDGDVWQADGADVVVEVVPRALRIVVPG
jgi:YegS/Rv2252/BmrU family lipid kinase